jgi:hypothetical protein
MIQKITIDPTVDGNPERIPIAAISRIGMGQDDGSPVRPSALTLKISKTPDGGSDGGEPA